MAMALKSSSSLSSVIGKFSLLQRLSSFWSHVNMGPPDAILGVTEAFKKDKNADKINVGVGAYRDDDGKPYVLPVVRCAEERMMANHMNHEYAPIAGASEFGLEALKLALGADSPVIAEKRFSAFQTVSGTGSLRVGAAFLGAFHCGPKIVNLPKPTWGNHIPIFKHSGVDVAYYKYYDPECITFDYKGCKTDLCKLPAKSIVLIHACAHNPTGVDPSHQQWDELAQLCKEKQFLVYFDMAYQGFASGDFDKDAYSVRKFVAEGNDIMLSQSFAKNMGLYGERVGCLSIVTDTPETAAKVASQVKILIRPMYSNPPIHGARIAMEILTDPELKHQWCGEVKEMADRIISVRKDLRRYLEEAGSTKNWKHISDQIGMFCYTGLKPEEVDQLTSKHSIYLTKDGRISMAGVTSKNVKYLANAMHEVTKATKS